MSKNTKTRIDRKKKKREVYIMNNEFRNSLKEENVDPLTLKFMLRTNKNYPKIFIINL